VGTKGSTMFQDIHCDPHKTQLSFSRGYVERVVAKAGICKKAVYRQIKRRKETARAVILGDTATKRPWLLYFVIFRYGVDHSLPADVRLSSLLFARGQAPASQSCSGQDSRS
jgi:hypothetical protein